MREDVGVFDVSHLGKGVVRGRAPSSSSTPGSPTTFGGSASGRRSTRCAATRRPAAWWTTSSRTSAARTRCSSSPTRRTAARSCGRLQADAPAGIEVEDLHTTLAVLAVQGPRSPEVVEALGLPTGHDYMSFTGAEWQGRPVVVCRTGYTGERGYELLPRWDDAGELWDAVLARASLPCGLGARDTLRTEMGYPLHGQDLSLEITPGAGPLGLGGRLGQAGVLGPRGAAARARAGPGAAAVGPGVARPRASRARTWRSARAARWSARSPAGRSRRPARSASAWRCSTRGRRGRSEVTVDVRGRTTPMRVVKPPFVPSRVR